MTLRTLLSRLGWQRSHRSGAVGKGRLLSVIRGDREAHKAAQPPPPPPTPEELIEQGILKIIPACEPKLALFTLPPGGEGFLRHAGIAKDQHGTVFATVDLVPSDDFWLDDRRFPDGEWKQVRIGDRVVKVQRDGRILWVRDPQMGDQPGCWMPLKFK